MTMFPRILCCFAAVAAGLCAQTDARRIFVASGDGTTATMNVYSGDPFQLQSSVNASPFVQFVLNAPDGSKYFVFPRQGTATFLTFDSGLSGTPRSMNLGRSAQAAGISPDGRRMVVVAGTVYLIDPTTEGIAGSLDAGSNPIDVAFTPDSTQAFVLSGDSQRLTAINLSNNSIAGTLTVAAGATGVSVGPNGLVYVVAPGSVQEIDPRTLTIRSTMAVNGFPGKLVFTPDGTRAVSLNQYISSGASLFLFDMNSRTLSGTLTGVNTVFDRVFTVSNTRAIAVSAQSGRVYDISLVPLQVTTDQYASITNARSAVVSNELPTARFVYISTATGILRYDLSSNTLAGQIPVTYTTGAINYLAPAFSGSIADAIAYNATQSVPSGTQSLPIVIRAIDSNGRPLSNVAVTFLPSSGTQVTGAMSATNSEGLASATVIAPAAPNGTTFTVTAYVGSIAKTFNFTIGAASTGGTGPTSGLAIYSGNGQVIQENFSTAFNQTPLVAIVRDAAGNPVPNTYVTFQITSGGGGISGGPNGTVYNSGSGSLTILTDSAGLASIQYTASVIPLGIPYQTSNISATTGTQTVNFVVTSVIASVPGGGGPAPLPATSLIAPTTDSISGKAGDVIPGAVQVRVALQAGPGLGQALPNVGVKIVNLAGAGGPTATCVSPNGDGTVLTDANGTASCDLLLGGKVGTAQIAVNVGGFNNLPSSGLNLTVLPGAPSTLTIVQGNNQTGNAGQQMPLALKVQVQDGFGNVLPGQAVQFQAVSNATLVAPTSQSTDQGGYASTLVRLGSAPGQAVVKVTAGSVSAQFTLSVNVSVSKLTAVSGDAQSAVIGTAFAQPLVVQVNDDKGGPVAGATVNFAVASGSATLSAASATTDAQGRAQVTVTAGSATGAVTVNASTTGSGGTITTPFSLSVRLAGPQFTAASVVNSASNQAGIAPLSLATIYASGIAPNLKGVLSANILTGPLPFTLGDVDSVTFNGIAAPIFAVANQNGQESVIVQVPGELAPSSSVSVTVRIVGGGATTVSGITVRDQAPGIFESLPDAQGRKFAAVMRPDGSFVTAGNPARRGEQLRILVTGLGQVSPGTATGRAGVGGQAVIAPVIVGLNDAGVRLISAEYAQNLVGVYIVTFQVPDDAATGDNRHLAVAAGDPAVFAPGSLLASLQ